MGFRTFHRFFSEGRWSPDKVGLIVLRLVVERRLKPGEAIIVPVDDTLGRHTGKKIAGASMHRDPLLSTGRRPFFHWGHLWVVVSVAVPAFGLVLVVVVVLGSRSVDPARASEYDNDSEHERLVSVADRSPA